MVANNILNVKIDVQYMNSNGKKIERYKIKEKKEEEKKKKWKEFISTER